MLRNVVVLIRSILDPEVPAERFEIDPRLNAPVPGLGAEILGPFEESALEVALQLRDEGAAERIIALAAGGPEAEDALRKALAVRVDDAIRIDAPEAGGDRRDPSQTAALLVAALGQVDDVDLVLAGRQAGDWDQGQVGFLVAERLGSPCVALAQSVTAGDDGRLRVRREVAGVEEVLSVAAPALITVTNHDGNRLRMAKVMDLMASSKRPIEQRTPADLGIDDATLAGAARLRFGDVWKVAQSRDCELIEAEDAAGVAAALLTRLEERKVLGG